MRLAAVDLWRYDLPLRRPMAARGKAMRRQGLLVSARDESGRVAWGEAAPLPDDGSETMEEAETGLRRLATRQGLALPSDPATVPSWLAALRLGVAARCAAETAILGLMAQAKGVLLHHLLWPKPVEQVSVAGLIDRQGTLAEVAARAGALVAQGCQTLKLKVGGGPLEDDLARIAAIGQAVPGTPLRLDANRIWSPGDAHAAMAVLKRTGAPIDYIEEPIAVGGLLPDARLPQALDETLIHASPDVQQAWLSRQPDAVVLKPMLLGFVTSWRLAKNAAERGIDVVISSSFETGVGLRLAAALAAGTSTVAGLGTADWFAQDLMAPPSPCCIALDDGPPAPDPAALAAFCHAL